MVVPSLFPETFGYVVLEAFAVRTPVIVHEGGGAIRETGVLSGGGLGYKTDGELLLAMRRMVHDDDLREDLAHRGYAMRIGEWSETAHLDRYFALIQGIKAGRGRCPRLGPTSAPWAMDGAARVGRDDVGIGLTSTPARDAPMSRLPTRRIAAFVAPDGPSCLACFGRLVADPTALIVDADRPSLDHAKARSVRRPDRRQRPDPALPAPSPGDRPVDRPGSATSRSGTTAGFGGRPLIGNPQGGPLLPADLARLVVRRPVELSAGSPSAICCSRSDRVPIGWVGTLGMGGWGSVVAAGHASGCRLTSWPRRLRRALSARLGGLLVPLGFRRGDPASPGPAKERPHGAGHDPRGHLPRPGTRRRGTTWRSSRSACWAALRWDRRRRSGRTIGGEALGLWGGWAVALVLAVGLDRRGAGPRRDGPTLVPPNGPRSRSGWRAAITSIRSTPSSSSGPATLGGPAEYFGHENYWESVTSIGLIPLVLAIIGVAAAADRRAARGWLVLVVLALVFASGRKFGLFALLYEVVPGMGRFRVPARSLFLASLGASMLAGLGVEALRAGSCRATAWGRPARRIVIGSALLALVVLAGGRAGARHHEGRLTEVDRMTFGLSRLSRDPTFFAALGGTAFLLALGAGWPGGRRGLACALGLLGLVELGFHGKGLIATTPAGRFLGPDPIGEALEGARPPGLEAPRIRVVDALYDDLCAGLRGFTKTNVNDSFQVQHAADLYATLYHLFDDRLEDRDGPMDRAVAAYRLEVRRSVLDRMGVALLVSDALDAGSPWPLVASGTWGCSTYAVHTNPTVMPRAYVVPRAEVSPDDASIVARFREFDPRGSVVMPVDPLGPDTTGRQPFIPAEWASTDPDRVVLRVATEAPGLLVVAETWMPGWTAEVDGQPAPVLRGNRAQRVIPLPKPGRHEIILRYRTPGLTLGLALTTASALIWSGLMLPKITRRPHAVDPPTTVIDPAVTDAIC